MFWYGNAMGGFGYLMMALNGLLFWALVITAVVLVVRYVNAERHRGGWPGTPTAGRPEQILAERFARGELDEREYAQRLRVLRGLPAEPPAGAP